MNQTRNTPLIDEWTWMNNKRCSPLFNVHPIFVWPFFAHFIQFLIHFYVHIVLLILGGHWLMLDTISRNTSSQTTTHANNQSCQSLRVHRTLINKFKNEPQYLPDQFSSIYWINHKWTAERYTLQHRLRSSLNDVKSIIKNRGPQNHIIFIWAF